MGGKGGARSSVARRPRGPRGPYERRLSLVRPLIFKARLRIITTTATAQLQLCLQKHYLFALSLHKPSLSSAQSLHGRLLLLLRLALLRCSLARTVSSRFPPPPRLSSPVRYRTCVVMYTACLCKGGICRGRPQQPARTVRQTPFVCVPSITAGRAAPNFPY